MSVEGWILMVGLRVVDLGALVVWLVWFYRQCDDNDDDSSDGDDFRRRDADEPEEPRPPTGGGGVRVPLPDAAPWPTRRRGHGDVTWPPAAPTRRQPVPRRVPTRVGRES